MVSTFKARPFVLEAKGAAVSWTRLAIPAALRAFWRDFIAL
jgi:hypothetical protein